MKKSTPVISTEVPQQWYRKRNVLIDIAVILAVAVIITVIWWVGHRPGPADTASDVPQYDTQALTEEVHKKYGLNDYSGAIKLIKGQKTINKTDTQLLLASAYANQGDQAAALKIYDKLRGEGELTASSLAAAAKLAEQANDNAKALDYYKAAVQKLQADKNPAVSDHLPMYQAKVDELTKKVLQ